VTNPGVLSDAEIETLRSVCAMFPEVEAGYVCSVERDTGETVSFCVKLNYPVSAVEDGRDALRNLARAFARTDSELMRKVGAGVLADRAVAPWKRQGLQVYGT
jgi:hypothetical protein